jgi:hypothetical protein
MTRSITPKGKQYLSQFILLRHHRKLLADKRVADIRVRELAGANDAAKESATVSDRSRGRAQSALETSERGLVFINKRIATIEAALGHPER